MTAMPIPRSSTGTAGSAVCNPTGHNEVEFGAGSGFVDEDVDRLVLPAQV